MLAEFMASGRFQTYRGERNPSFSANCNGLSCLLVQSDVMAYYEEIVQITEYLLTQVLQGSVNDKWVSSFPRVQQAAKAFRLVCV